jgi:hypothetical protein
MLFSKITIRLNRMPFQNQQVIKGLSYYFHQDSGKDKQSINTQHNMWWTPLYANKHK